MIAKKRVPIPKPIEREVLFRNQSVCCICHKSGVQIHHIDDNPSNNKINNLCVLCIEHHAEASNKTGMTKALDASLLRKYKKEWEGLVLRKHQEHQKEQPKASNIEKEITRFEIKKTIYSLPKKTKKETEEIMDYLFQFHLFEENITEYILETLDGVRWFFTGAQLGVIAEKVFEYFWHLVGPDHVPMGRSDEIKIRKAIELLEGIGTQTAIFESNLSALNIVVDKSLPRLFEVCESYKKKKLGQRVLKAYKDIEEEWKDTTQAPGNERKKSPAQAVKTISKVYNRLNNRLQKIQR